MGRRTPGLVEREERIVLFGRCAGCGVAQVEDEAGDEYGCHTEREQGRQVSREKRDKNGMCVTYASVNMVMYSTVCAEAGASGVGEDIGRVGVEHVLARMLRLCVVC